MNIEQQAFLIHAMSGKNLHTVNPTHVTAPKNVRNLNNVSIIDNNLNASPAQDPNGNIDGSSPVEGTNLGINI